MTNTRAMVTLVAALVLLGGYIGLATAMGITQFWVGFLFLFQWSVMEQSNVEAMPKSIVGGFVGILTATLPVLLAPTLGANPAAAVQLAVILVLLFLFIKQAATFVVSAAAMLFLTVINIPLIVAGATPAELFIGLAAGVVYFGGIVVLGTWIAGRLAKPERQVVAG